MEKLFGWYNYASCEYGPALGLVEAGLWKDGKKCEVLIQVDRAVLTAEERMLYGHGEVTQNSFSLTLLLWYTEFCYSCVYSSLLPKSRKALTSRPDLVNGSADSLEED
jgi:hypothetical protein